MGKIEKPITLEDLIPAEPKFTLSMSGAHCGLRPPNLEDELWFRDKGFEHATLNKALQNQDWSILIHVVYRLLDRETKSQFLAQKMPEVNDEGVEEEVMVSGPYAFLRALTPNDKGPVISALLRAFMLANPESRELVEESLKKNLKMMNGLQKLAGPKSSTSSSQNTGLKTGRSFK